MGSDRPQDDRAGARPACFPEQDSATRTVAARCWLDSIGRVQALIRLTFSLAVAAGLAYGHGAVGTLNGTILDSTGAVIPGSTVIATNAGTALESATSSTTAGAYTLPYLQPGTYTLRISARGFRTANQENVILRVGQTMTINVTMQLGAVAEEVTVSATPPLLESGTAEIGRYVSSEEYQNWPIFVEDGQRQIQSFIFRSLPGTTGGEFEGSINGGQQYSYEILIEGIPVGRMDLSGGNNNEMRPSAEAVGEFKLHTGSTIVYYGAWRGSWLRARRGLVLIFTPCIHRRRPSRCHQPQTVSRR